MLARRVQALQSLRAAWAAQSLPGALTLDCSFAACSTSRSAHSNSDVHSTTVLCVRKDGQVGGWAWGSLNWVWYDA